MIYVGGELEGSSLLISIMFILWLIFLFLNKTKLILREKLTYLKNFWSLLDLTIIVVSMCCIIMYIVRIRNIGRLLNAIETVKHNEFVNYFDLFYTHSTLNVIGALLVCISTIRLWKLMRFFKMVRMFEKTFLLLIGPVLALFLHHFIFVGMYALMTHILMGENSADFVDNKNSFKSLINMYLNFYSNYVLLLGRTISRLEVTVMVIYLIVSKIFFSTYIVICVMAHLDARKLFSQYQDEAYSFIDYIKEELMFLFAWFNLRKTHHKEPMIKKQVIYPKPDRYLCANCISTTKHSMDGMALVAALVLYNTIHTGDRDGALNEKRIEMMLMVCHYFLSEHVSKDHKEIFFKIHEGEVLKIVDSRRIDKAKQVVDLILGVSAKLEKRVKLNRRIVLRHNLRDLDKMQRKLESCLNSLENIDFDEQNDQ